MDLCVFCSMSGTELHDYCSANPLACVVFQAPNPSESGEVPMQEGLKKGRNKHNGRFRTTGMAGGFFIVK